MNPYKISKKSQAAWIGIIFAIDDFVMNSTEIMNPTEQSLENEIEALAKEMYYDTNCEPDHDLVNWKCAEKMVQQKQHAAEELSKIATVGHF